MSSRPKRQRLAEGVYALPSQNRKERNGYDKAADPTLLNSLIALGWSRNKVDHALRMHNNDEEKAKVWLIRNGLITLGWSRNKVDHALCMHNNDEEKAKVWLIEQDFHEQTETEDVDVESAEELNNDDDAKDELNDDADAKDTEDDDDDAEDMEDVESTESELVADSISTQVVVSGGVVSDENQTLLNDILSFQTTLTSVSTATGKFLSLSPLSLFVYDYSLIDMSLISCTSIRQRESQDSKSYASYCVRCSGCGFILARSVYQR